MDKYKSVPHEIEAFQFTEKARRGDWICRHSNGELFVLSNDRFKSSYKSTKPFRCKNTVDLEEIINQKERK